MYMNNIQHLFENKILLRGNSSKVAMMFSFDGHTTCYNCGSVRPVGSGGAMSGERESVQFGRENFHGVSTANLIGNMSTNIPHTLLFLYIYIVSYLSN